MISTHNAEHYRWGQDCDGWHLVKSSTLSVIQEFMPPGRSEVRHLHVASRQFFFVLAGRLSIEVEGQLQVLSSQQGLEISPGQAHRVFNDSAGDSAFLVISSPPSHGDRVLAE